ncbi:MAG: ATP-dependent helicase, partial [Candidatus Parcubacteria bacterium]|nr:ATP-dependent helicase [Leptolyngbyaceae cyanobacterium LF-bin-113]
MAVLHGSWLFQTQSAGLQGGLLIWGEAWRRLDSSSEEGADSLITTHPYSMSRAELLTHLTELQHAKRLSLPFLETVTIAKSKSKRGKAPENSAVDEIGRWRSQIIALPSAALESDETLIPHLSAAASSQPVLLYPWQVEGLWLSPIEALQFLNSLPLGSLNEEDSFLGGDLRFWSHTARWSLDLLARSKFLPALKAQEDVAIASWEALLDSSTDQTRLGNFAKLMPSVCRTYQQESLGDCLAIELPPEPQALLSSFLNQVVDAQIRVTVDQHPIPTKLSREAVARGGVLIESPLREWLQSLGQSSQVHADGLDRLESALTTWKAPLRNYQTAQFRACLRLQPPISHQKNWTLEYLLQAIDNAEFLVSASVIWQNPVDRLVYQGRTIDHPQETLLMGLGLASRLYSLMEPSLQEARPQSCQLTPVQAYELIMNGSWRLQDSGLGVILPPSLANRGGWANRLGLKIQASTLTKQKKGQLGLQSLLNFRWELAIGGHSIPKAEFDRLVALNAPLVEINGEWVELRSQDIKAAQAFFAARKDQTTLSLEDALRISTGDTQSIEKLPVVSFEASGALQELVTTLTGNQSLEEIETPKDFHGELRPYQSRGVAWLAFLERWSLGACLADDMGLGKTVQFIAFMLHLREQGTLEQPILLVCPTSVLG